MCEIDFSDSMLATYNIGDEQMYEIRIIEYPTVVLLAEQSLNYQGLRHFAQYLHEQGGCGLTNNAIDDPMGELFKHGGKRQNATNKLQDNAYGDLTANEMLCELAGRKCYNSFGDKIGHGDNEGYIANILGAPGRIPHASVLYHAKMTFFFAGISRRMTHELIRHYVGADRSEEGCPSQESTRYTEHPGHFIAHPRILESSAQMIDFSDSMLAAYNRYRGYIDGQIRVYQEDNAGADPKGMDRKRIYEAASSYLPGCASTSMVWTTNPVALQKLFLERCDAAADLEFQRFARCLRQVCYDRWPNLFRDSNPRTK